MPVRSNQLSARRKCGLEEVRSRYHGTCRTLSHRARPRSMPSTTSLTIPVEVFDLILDNFDPENVEDRKSLCNISLTAWSLVNPCRKRLLFSIQFEWESQAQRLDDFLESHPELAQDVKNIAFIFMHSDGRRDPDSPSPYILDYPERIDSLSKRLCEVEKLSVEGDELVWPAELNAPFTRFFQLPSLTQLHLHDIVEFSIPLLSVCQNLKFLTLDSIKFGEEEWPTTPGLNPFTNLEMLHLIDSGEAGLDLIICIYNASETDPQPSADSGHAGIVLPRLTSLLVKDDYDNVTPDVWSPFLASCADSVSDVSLLLCSDCAPFDEHPTELDLEVQARTVSKLRNLRRLDIIFHPQPIGFGTLIGEPALAQFLAIINGLSDTSHPCSKLEQISMNILPPWVVWKEEDLQPSHVLSEFRRFAASEVWKAADLGLGRKLPDGCHFKISVCLLKDAAAIANLPGVTEIANSVVEQMPILNERNIVHVVIEGWQVA